MAIVGMGEGGGAAYELSADGTHWVQVTDSAGYQAVDDATAGLSGVVVDTGTKKIIDQTPTSKTQYGDLVGMSTQSKQLPYVGPYKPSPVSPMGKKEEFGLKAGETPYEGELRYFGNILYKYINGEWVSQEFGPTAPVGGDMAGQDLYSQPYSVGSPQWMEEVYGPQAGYLTGLGLFGKQARTPYQSYQERMFPLLQSLYGLTGQFAAGNVPGYAAPGGYMGQWGQPYAENPFAMYAQAKGMLGDVAGMSPEQRAGFGLQGPTDTLSSLMGMGLRPQLGLQGASWLAGRLPTEEESWIAQYPQQQGPSFLDYIMQKYNLGRFF